MNSTEFCAKLLDQEKVAAVPGIAFGDDTCLRLSYATGDKILAEGVRRLGVFCASLKR